MSEKGRKYAKAGREFLAELRHIEGSDRAAFKMAPEEIQGFCDELRKLFPIDSWAEIKWDGKDTLTVERLPGLDNEAWIQEARRRVHNARV